MASTGSELVVHARVYDLLDWLLPKGQRFPRPYRDTVTARLMNAALDLAEALLTAQSQRGHQRLISLREADACLNRLRVYLRLVHQWQWLSHGQHEHASAMVAEIGRLVGGWIKQTAAAVAR